MWRLKHFILLMCIVYTFLLLASCADTEAINNSAQDQWELINAEDHPRYSDPISSAQSFWNGSSLVGIHSEIDYANKDSSQKKVININFDISSGEDIQRIDIAIPEPETVSIDTLLKTTCSYLPKLIVLSNSYILDDPYILSTEDGEKYYILHYTGQNSAKYPKIVCLISRDTITISNDMPNWLQRDALNELTYEPWDITIENYFPDTDQKEWEEEQVLIQYAKEKAQKESFQ